MSSTISQLERAKARERAEMFANKDNGYTASSQASDRSVPKDQNLIPDWAKEMEILGVTYAILVEMVRELGWILLPPRPGTDNEKFVITEPTHGNTHSYLSISNLDPGFQNIPLVTYYEGAMCHGLAHAEDGVENFGLRWNESGWYGSEAYVDKLAERADTIENEDAGPMSTTSWLNPNVQPGG